MESVDLFLGKPVPLISHFIGLHPGMMQQRIDIHIFISLVDELDIAVDDSAIVKWSFLHFQRLNHIVKKPFEILKLEKPQYAIQISKVIIRML